MKVELPQIDLDVCGVIRFVGLALLAVAVDFDKQVIVARCHAAGNRQPQVGVGVTGVGIQRPGIGRIEISHLRVLVGVELIIRGQVEDVVPARAGADVAVVEHAPTDLDGRSYCDRAGRRAEARRFQVGRRDRDRHGHVIIAFIRLGLVIVGVGPEDQVFGPAAAQGYRLGHRVLGPAGQRGKIVVPLAVQIGVVHIIEGVVGEVEFVGPVLGRRRFCADVLDDP